MRFFISLVPRVLLALTVLGTAHNLAQAEIVTIQGGSLSISYDGSVFANTANSSFGLSSANGDFMRYGRYWAPSETVTGPTFTAKSPAAYRPIPISNPGPGPNPKQPNFRDNFSTLNPLYPVTSPTNNLGVNGAGTISNSAGSNRRSTTLSYDTADVLGSMTGTVETNGVSAWWFANTAIMNAGGSWVSWGELSLRYDASRTALGYSGWVLASQLGGTGDLFDTDNISFTADSSGINLSGDLFGSDGSSTDPYNENPSTWETYTLMKPDLKIGTFSFTGNSEVTAVPEPSSMVLGATLLAAGAVTKRLRRAKKRNDQNV